MKTIASEVGTSIATVSLALADHPRVNDVTKERVRQASLRLGYCTPDELAARGRRNGESESPRALLKFLVVGNKTRMNVASEILAPLMGLPAELGMRLELDGLIDAEPGSERELNWLRAHAAEAQALILHGVPTGAALTALIRSATPVVLIGPTPVDLPQATDLRMRSVGFDEVAAGRRATQALIAQGHRRIALVSARGIAGLYYDRWEDGYRLALSRAGITFDERLVDRGGDRIDTAAPHPFFADPAACPTAYVVPDPSHLAVLGKLLAARGERISPDRVVIGGSTGTRLLPDAEGLPAICADPRQLMATALELVRDLLTARPGHFLSCYLPHQTVHLDRLGPPTPDNPPVTPKSHT